MVTTVIGIFNDSKEAGEAVAALKNEGFMDDISVVSKDDGEIKSHEIQQDVSDGAIVGVAGGAAIGGTAAIIAGASAIALPGLGLLAAGPIAALLTAAGIGALAGGLVGALVDYGVPEELASDYQDRINNGQVLVAITTENQEAARILERRGAAVQSYST